MERSSKRRKLDFSDEFTLVVGSPKQHRSSKSYTVYKEVLIKSSDFFKAACNKEWEEGQTKTIKLPEVWPGAFDLYLHFLYTGEVVIPQDSLDALQDKAITWWGNGKEISKTHWILSEAYLVADMLMDIPAKNTIMDSFMESILPELPYIPRINQILEQTPKGSPLRRCLVDQVAFGVSPKHMERLGEKFSKEVLKEVTVALMKVQTGIEEKPIWWRPGCVYHEHDEEHPKCK